MKYKNKIIIFVLLIAGLTACKRDEIFEREQYKQVIALKSEGTFKIFNQDLDLDVLDGDGYFNGFIAATVGGSLATEKPIKLSIVNDMALFNEYNEFSYAQQTYLYAQLIPNYVINDYAINIPTGERTGLMKIRVNPKGLSPDSSYMLAFRVNSTSAYEMNLNKSTVLYRVYLKNFYSTTRSVPQYTHKGSQARIDIVDQLPITTMMQKHLHPVDQNTVRIFAGGNQIFDAGSRTLDQTILKWGIKLTMDANGKITITPWNTTSPYGMKVKQIDAACGKANCRVCDNDGYEAAAPADRLNCHYDPYYSNTFSIYDDGWGRKYKLFLLSYEYWDPDNGRQFMMKEELKIDYVPEKE